MSDVPRFRAAYKASQPLFDALQSADSHTQEQVIHLHLSMAEVEKIHVTLRSERLDGASILGEGYVRHITTAWQTMTESFTSIFHELHELTKPDAAQGRTEKQGHRTIHRLYKSALAAKSTAYSLNPGVTKLQSTWRSPGTSSTNTRAADIDESSSEQRASKVRRTGCPPSGCHGKKRGVMKESEEIELHRLSKLRRTEDKDSVSTNSKSASCADRNDRAPSSTTRSRSQSARTSPTKDVPTDVEMEDSGDAPAAERHDLYHSLAPGVRYADVTAEVEERLRMKELRRTETKGDAKRKRPSSDMFHAKVFAVEQAQEQSLMPASKRVRQKPVPGSERGYSRNSDQVSGWKRHTLYANESGPPLKKPKW